MRSIDLPNHLNCENACVCNPASCGPDLPVNWVNPGNILPVGALLNSQSRTFWPFLFVKVSGETLSEFEETRASTFTSILAILENTGDQTLD